MSLNLTYSNKRKHFRRFDIKILTPKSRQAKNHWQKLIFLRFVLFFLNCKRDFYICSKCYRHVALHEKWSFPLRTSLVNVTKSAVYCGFGHIYWKKSSMEYLNFCAVSHGKFSHLHKIFFWQKVNMRKGYNSSSGAKVKFFIQRIL